MADPRFLRGARPSPRHELLAAEPYRVVTAPPAQAAWIPAKLDMWGNDQYGDCVTAEEAFAKATYSPEIFIDAATVEAWAKKHGVLNGADLTSVMDAMQKDGFQVGSQQYDDGPYTGVDYSNETVLQSAIAQGAVKIAIDANALPSGAGNQSGWHATGGGRHPNTDHCVSLCGYGPAGWLYQQLGVPLPSGLSATQSGYLLYTWSTIGFVDHPWIMGTCTEAWVRNPTTVGVPPLTPPVPPTPPSPPAPVVSDITLAGVLKILGFSEPITLTGTRSGSAITLGGSVKLLGFTEPITLTGTDTPRSVKLAAGRNWLTVLQDLLQLETDAVAQNWTAVLADLEKLKTDWLAAKLEGSIGARNWLVIAEDLAALALDVAAKNIPGILADLAKLRADWVA